MLDVKTAHHSSSHSHSSRKQSPEDSGPVVVMNIAWAVERRYVHHGEPAKEFNRFSLCCVIDTSSRASLFIVVFYSLLIFSQPQRPSDLVLRYYAL
jgi:hypothetical protein